MPRPLRRWAVAGLFAASLIALAPIPRAAAGFTADQQAQLDAGELVVEPVAYAREDGTYVGGVSYFIADAKVAAVATVARTWSRWGELLPNVESVDLLSIDAQGVTRLRIRHRLGPTHGGYTVLCSFAEGGRFGRFWLDPTGDNALRDGWGFARLTPLADGRTLITYGLLFDLGPGLMRALFEGRIRRAALEYPRRLAHAAR